MIILRLLMVTAGLLLMTIVMSRGHILGSKCHMNEDCTEEVMSSLCDGGTCVCLPHYVPYNASMCIQDSLLGYTCLLNSQCENRVENSTCDKNICRCKKGFVPYKKHTCLSPARQGEICFSDEHCAMWDSDSSCDYSIIPNVIGRCRCKAETRQVGSYCLHRTSEIRARTLGFQCENDAECEAADPNSRCMNGFCDCMPVKNAKSAIPRCSALNTGCYPSTYQCKSSGECISWFFVCDGRQHCADGSDETQCDGPDCPALSYTCKSGGCVSRAAICDGRSDCPDGEDEAGCLGERNCPSYTLRCRGAAPRCLPEYELCNAIKSCPDGSDELRSVCRGRLTNSTTSKSPRAPALPGITNTPTCPFRCGNGRCRSSAVVCSGRDGCGDNSDEEHCSVCRCPSP